MSEVATWSDITQPYGVYVSKTYNISSPMDRYISEIETIYTNPQNQTVNFFYSVSYDGAEWTSWRPFQSGSTDIFNDYGLSNLLFRYKVEMHATSEHARPYLQRVSFRLSPFLNIENLGDLEVKPKLWIKKKNGSGDISLINHFTGQTITMKNLINEEEVFLDCENEVIISSRQDLGVYRYDDHNDEWLELQVGDNYLKGTGNFDIDVRYQGKLLQE